MTEGMRIKNRSQGRPSLRNLNVDPASARLTGLQSSKLRCILSQKAGLGTAAGLGVEGLMCAERGQTPPELSSKPPLGFTG